MPNQIDFPNEFLEPTISSTPSMQLKSHTFFSPAAGCSSDNSSSSSSQNRLACDDSGVSSNVTLANDTENSLHFFSLALTSTVSECMENSTPLNFASNDLLDDLEPVTRDRCNTWPTQHPNSDFQPNNSPVIHERIPEEELNESQLSVNACQEASLANNPINTNYQLPHSDNNDRDLNDDSPCTNYSDGNLLDEDDYQGTVQKRSQTRRNAWGNLSYADLITQAILSSPDQRLTLSQVYEWMVENVPYFADKGDSNSSAGWKNSIRHNLSLHSRFMRVQNEGAGKSSWWVINPEAKSAKNPRRRATIDVSTKHAIEKKRRGARKRAEVQMQGSLSGGRKASQPDFYHNQTKEEPENDSDPDLYRSRKVSNMSAPGSGSQISSGFNTNNDDFNYPPWAPNTTAQTTSDINSLHYTTSCSNTMNEIMDRTDQICLYSDNEYNQMSSLNSSQQMSAYSSVPQQISPNFQIKQEEVKPQFQQTSYQELKVVRGVDQQMQNPLLRNQLAQQSRFQQQPAQCSPTQQQNQSCNNYPFGCNGVVNHQRWVTNVQPSASEFVQSTQFQQPMGHNNQQKHFVSSSPASQSTISNQQFTLPKDLQNLNTFISADCNVEGIDEIIRQELSTSSNLNFDF